MVTTSVVQYRLPSRSRVLLFSIKLRIISEGQCVTSTFSLKCIYQRDVRCSLRSVFWFESKVIPRDFSRALHNSRSHSKRRYKKKKWRISGDLLQGTPRCLDWSRGKVIPNQLHHALSLDRCCVRTRTRTEHVYTNVYSLYSHNKTLSYFSAPPISRRCPSLDYACFSDCRDSSVIHNCMVHHVGVDCRL